MNVYQCWYRGLNGYCCRSHNAKWLFVPELGQTDKRIHKHISFSELVFHNSAARRYELGIENKMSKTQNNPLRFLLSLFSSKPQANTIGGMLFSMV